MKFRSAFLVRRYGLERYGFVEDVGGKWMAALGCSTAPVVGWLLRLAGSSRIPQILILHLVCEVSGDQYPTAGRASSPPFRSCPMRPITVALNSQAPPTFGKFPPAYHTGRENILFWWNSAPDKASETQLKRWIWAWSNWYTMHRIDEDLWKFWLGEKNSLRKSFKYYSQRNNLQNYEEWKQDFRIRDGNWSRSVVTNCRSCNSPNFTNFFLQIVF